MAAGMKFTAPDALKCKKGGEIKYSNAQIHQNNPRYLLPDRDS